MDVSNFAFNAFRHFQTAGTTVAMTWIRRGDWPDWLDWTAVLLFLGLIVLLPLVGHWLMVIDIRLYYRRLKGVMVLVVHRFPTLPQWARHQTPYCLRVLGLSFPCTLTQVRTAYHRLAEQCHPDRGGDPRQFQKLHRHFENALEFVRQQEESS